MPQTNSTEWRVFTSLGASLRQLSVGEIANHSSHSFSASLAHSRSILRVTGNNVAHSTLSGGGGGSGRQSSLWPSDNRVELKIAEVGEKKEQQREYSRCHQNDNFHVKADDHGVVSGADGELGISMQHKHQKGAHSRKGGYSMEVSRELVPSAAASVVSGVRPESITDAVEAFSSGEQKQINEDGIERQFLQDEAEAKKKRRKRRERIRSVMSIKAFDVDKGESEVAGMSSIARHSAGCVSRSEDPPESVFFDGDGTGQIPNCVHFSDVYTEDTAVSPFRVVAHRRVELCGHGSKGGDEPEGLEVTMNGVGEPLAAKGSMSREHDIFFPQIEPKGCLAEEFCVLMAAEKQQNCPREISSPECDRDLIPSMETGEYIGSPQQFISSSPEIILRAARGSSCGSFSPTEETVNSFQVSQTESDLSSFMVRYSKPPFASCCVDRSNPDGWQCNRPRRHAFQWPLHFLQIIALTLTALSTILFWASILPTYVLLYRSGGFSNCLPEMVVLVTLTGSAILSTCILWAVISFRENGDISNEGEPCTYCRRLTHSDARHCKACNKCISGFDHHCKWLNMCIGEKNYRIFIAFLVSSALSMLLAFVSGVVLLARWWSYLSPYSLFFRIGPIVLCVLMLLAVPPLLHLLGFHIMLHRLGMTTFEYLIQRRRVMRDPHAVASATDAGKELHAHEVREP
ncbi:putative palmitoyl acyltransferase 7 [Trypanosoma cruzi]|nr:putative palmitoyl acyltransferase 7 [Trypanosoma cruzi]